MSLFLRSFSFSQIHGTVDSLWIVLGLSRPLSAYPSVPIQNGNLGRLIPALYGANHPRFLLMNNELQKQMCE